MTRCYTMTCRCRFRGPIPIPPQHRPLGSGGKDDPMFQRQSVVKDQDLKEFDKLLKTDMPDGGWARAQGEIDYRYVR